MSVDSGSPAVSPPKKSKQPRYELTKDQKSLIKADTVNSKLWEELLASAKEEGTVRLTYLVVYCCDTCVGSLCKPLVCTYCLALQSL